MDTKEKLAELKELIQKANYIVFFGGAGVSTESGLPDFRSVDGLYHQKYAFPPEEILSHDFFMTRPKEFYKFYKEKLLISGILPNPAHYALQKLEEQGKLKAIITQNIDGLHQMAGSKTVYELHGSIHRYYCVKHHHRIPEEEIDFSTSIPLCPHCRSMIRPDVVLYQEGLDERILSESIAHIQNADLLIIGGTSLTVYPAAGLIRYFPHHGNNKLVLINKEEGRLDTECDLVLYGKIGEILSEVVS
ncbi:NAD-dependent protein deacylase [Oribacterium sinus]|uniref:NAD-dependent protein deacylase n=1 Tax=Oribacterium sinus TaxID=237576 RepID=UPI0028E1ABB8|nr:NAD-dependent protein deacylase [Oribacterium sinus]